MIVSGSKYVPAPEGLHNAACVDLIDLGIVETQWGKQAKIKLVWELDPDTAGLMADGRRFTISQRYTPSLHEKSRLHKDLKSWRGRPFTPEELAGFELETVIGAPCKILIQHSEKDGQTYSNISAIMKADKDGKLIASGDYIRVKDREQQNGNGSNGSHDDGSEIPF